MKIKKSYILRPLRAYSLCLLTIRGGKDAEMDRFITDLMDRMTLREKLGQLNLPSGGDLVTGSVMNGELSDMDSQTGNRRLLQCQGDPEN